MENMENNDVLNKVEPNEVSDHYGNTKNMSVNDMYKKYVEWFQNKYSSPAKPLTFKEWIEWAKKRGLVKNNTKNMCKCEDMHVEGNNNDNPTEPPPADETKDEIKPPVVLPPPPKDEIKPPTVLPPPTRMKTQTGTFWAVSLLVLSAIFLVYNLCCREKEIQPIE